MSTENKNISEMKEILNSYIDNGILTKEQTQEIILKCYIEKVASHTTVAEIAEQTGYSDEFIKNVISNNKLKKYFPKNPIKNTATNKETTEERLDKFFKNCKTYKKITDVIKATGIHLYKIHKYLEKHPEIQRETPTTKSLLEEYFKKNPKYYTINEAKEYAHCTKQLVSQYMKDHNITNLTKEQKREKAIIEFLSRRHQFKDFNKLSQMLHIPEKEIKSVLSKKGIKLTRYNAGYYEVKPSEAFLAKLYA